MPAPAAGSLPLTVTFINGTLGTPANLVDAPVSPLMITFMPTPPGGVGTSMEFTVFGPGGNGEVDFIIPPGGGGIENVNFGAGTGTLFINVAFDPNSPNSVPGFPFDIYTGEDIAIVLELDFSGIRLDLINNVISVAANASGNFQLLPIAAVMIDDTIPEPGALAIWGTTGVAALAWRRRRGYRGDRAKSLG
jgi:hypothetical protein